MPEDVELERKREPWFPFHTADWRGDQGLRRCSYAARGLWADMLSLMHEAHPYGHLLLEKDVPAAKDLAELLGGSTREVQGLLDELERKGVFSRASNGVIYSRRMVRDRQRKKSARTNGLKGGNPALKQNRDVVLSEQDKRTDIPNARDTRLASGISDSGSGVSDKGREPVTRRSPLITPMRGDVAYPWRVPFPGRLLNEFAAKLGGPQELAERRVEDWVRTVIDSFPDDQPIPDSGDSYAWWRRQSRSLFPSAPVVSAKTQATRDGLNEFLARRES